MIKNSYRKCSTLYQAFYHIDLSFHIDIISFYHIGRLFLFSRQKRDKKLKKQHFTCNSSQERNDNTTQHKYLVFRKIICFYLIFCSSKVSATKTEILIKKKKTFSINYLFYGSAMAAVGEREGG
jgi:hypothetical protein